MFKKIATLSVLTAAISTSVMADGVKFLPVTETTYKPDFAVALLGGVQKTNAVDGTGAYGVEVSLKCPLLQIPSNEIRQQVSLVSTSSNGLSTTSLELNPHVMFNVAPQLHVGVGPNLGLVYATAHSDNKVAFGIGAGASISYDIAPKYFVGAETRYQWTNHPSLGGTDVNLDNSRTLLKVGMHF